MMNILTQKKTVIILMAVSFILITLSDLLIWQSTRTDQITALFPFPISGNIYPYLQSMAFITISLLAVMSILSMRAQHFFAYSMLLIAFLALVSLFDASRWIASLGGFPYIGSGQGVIKYAALVGIASYLMKPNKLSNNAIIWLNYLPVALVLLWIGAMKFMQFEAEGIKALVETSPFMFWLYDLFDLQTTSNLIGIYDLIALSLLGLGIKFKQLFWPGFMMCLSVFITTQTFLFSWPGALSSDSILSYGGQFLVKDMWYIANMLVIYQYRKVT